MNDMPSCYRETNRKARKPYRCCECRKPIKTGEEYIDISGIWNRTPESYKCCKNCYELYQHAISLMDEFGCRPDEGPSLGGLFSWISEFASADGNEMADALRIIN